MTSETWEPRNEERDRMIRIAGVAYVVIEPWPDDPNGLEKAAKLRDAIIADHNEASALRAELDKAERRIEDGESQDSGEVASRAIGNGSRDMTLPKGVEVHRPDPERVKAAFEAYRRVIQHEYRQRFGGCMTDCRVCYPTGAGTTEAN